MYSSIQVSNALVITVRCKLINIVFQIILLFFLEVPACFTYHIISISLCLDPVNTAIWLVSFDLITLSILCQIMAYVLSLHNNLDSP
jgi:hypothetical protein